MLFQMTKLLSSVRARRSVREFSNQEVSDEIIEELLKSAVYAPSPKNKQPWKFIVCKEKTKDLIAKTLSEYVDKKLNSGYHEKYLYMAKDTSNIIYQAPVLILVCYDESCRTNYDNDGEYWLLKSPQCESCDIQSIGAAIQNLLIEANNIGISSLWVCDILYAYDELIDIVKTNDTIIAGILLGYGKMIPKAPERNFNKIEWLK